MQMKLEETQGAGEKDTKGKAEQDAQRLQKTVARTARV